MPRILTIEEREYNRKKSNRIDKWKASGIIDEDIAAVYDYLITQTHCMICLKEYKNSRDRCLDHDHDTGEIRYICCNTCNTHFLREKFTLPVHTKIGKNNTSGQLCIYYSERDNIWEFRKMIKGERIYKCFHTLEEAVQYKIDNNYY